GRSPLPACTAWTFPRSSPSFAAWGEGCRGPTWSAASRQTSRSGWASAPRSGRRWSRRRAGFAKSHGRKAGVRLRTWRDDEKEDESHVDDGLGGGACGGGDGDGEEPARPSPLPAVAAHVIEPVAEGRSPG